MDLTKYLAMGVVLFVLRAVSRQSPHGSASGLKAIIGYWIHGYALFFFGFYAFARVFAPEELFADGQLTDRWVWITTTVCWLSLFAGSYFGWWVRRVARARNPEPQD